MVDRCDRFTNRKIKFYQVLLIILFKVLWELDLNTICSRSITNRFKIIQVLLIISWIQVKCSDKTQEQLLAILKRKFSWDKRVQDPLLINQLNYFENQLGWFLEEKRDKDLPMKMREWRYHLNQEIIWCHVGFKINLNLFWKHLVNLGILD